MIAVPVLITSVEGIDEMSRRIEDHYLGNDDPELFYALVSDWKDSDRERTESDDQLLAAAAAAIRHLNLRHGHDRFMLLHRARRWNAAQGVWMAGNASGENFMSSTGSCAGAWIPPSSTCPTKSPEASSTSSCWTPIRCCPACGPSPDWQDGTSAEPACFRHLSRAGRQRIRNHAATRHHRIAETREGVAFPKNLHHAPGIDPYVFASSDVYQDLFGEGSFIGKGIYDVDVFTAALHDRVPDNSLLSHDLLEGNLARAGLVSDVEVVEEFPEQYLIDVARHHRWARGDWQLLPWMFPPARGLSGLGLWKMSDNLRRTLNPPATLAAFFAGWVLLPSETAAAWTIFIAALLFIPALLPIFAGSGLRREPSTLKSQILTIRDDVVSAMALTSARLLLLAHQACVMFDAIGRTLYRLFVSRRRLLEWTASAQLQQTSTPGLAETYRKMTPSVAVGGLALLVSLSPLGGPTIAALPLALGWCLGPLFAYLISRPSRDESDRQVSPMSAASCERSLCRHGATSMCT